MDDYARVLNTGSSNLKLCVFQGPDDNRRVLEVSAAGRNRHFGRGRNCRSPPHEA